MHVKVIQSTALMNIRCAMQWKIVLYCDRCAKEWIAIDCSLAALKRSRRIALSQRLRIISIIIWSKHSQTLFWRISRFFDRTTKFLWINTLLDINQYRIWDFRNFWTKIYKSPRWPTHIAGRRQRGQRRWRRDIPASQITNPTSTGERTGTWTFGKCLTIA